MYLPHTYLAKIAGSRREVPPARATARDDGSLTIGPPHGRSDAREPFERLAMRMAVPVSAAGRDDDVTWANVVQEWGARRVPASVMTGVEELGPERVAEREDERRLGGMAEIAGQQRPAAAPM